MRPGVPLVLRDDVAHACLGVRSGRAVWVDVPEPVVLERSGDPADVVRRGDRLALRVGAGYLAALPRGGPDRGTALRVVPDPAPEWEVTGAAHGVAVAADHVVGLFNVRQGDFLVFPEAVVMPEAGVMPERDVASRSAPGWWAATDGGLPSPLWSRPPEGVPGDVELSGAVVPVADGDPGAGVLLLLDREVATMLTGHLRERAPELADLVAPGGLLGAVACRWPGDGVWTGVGTGRPALPATGARLWVQGPLRAEPGPAVDPVRSIAWAVDAAGHQVEAAPGGNGWPELALTWHLVLLPADGMPGRATVWSLPLPLADGEPGSTTTFTPSSGPSSGPPQPPPLGGRHARSDVLPSIVADPRTGRRALRIELVRGPAGEAVRVACTARVHRRDAAAGPRG